jgi:hypothetical protein
MVPPKVAMLLSCILVGFIIYSLGMYSGLKVPVSDFIWNETVEHRTDDSESTPAGKKFTEPLPNSK